VYTDTGWDHHSLVTSQEQPTDWRPRPHMSDESAKYNSWFQLWQLTKLKPWKVYLNWPIWSVYLVLCV